MSLPSRTEIGKNRFIEVGDYENLEAGPFFRFPILNDYEDLIRLISEHFNIDQNCKYLIDRTGRPIENTMLLNPNTRYFILTVGNYDDAINETPLVEEPVLELNDLKTPSLVKKYKSVAEAEFSVRQNVKNSIVSLFETFKGSHGSVLPQNELANLTNEMRLGYFVNMLMNQSINPKHDLLVCDIGKETTKHVLDNITCEDAQNVKFAFTGPSKSGRTTLLHIAATLFFEKSLIGNPAESLFHVAVNYGLLSKVRSHIEFYEAMVHITFDAMYCNTPRFVPILTNLKRYFLEVVRPKTLSPFPQELAKFDGFPVAEFSDLLANLEYSLSKNKAEFLRLSACLPSDFAIKLGFPGAFYFVDNFDECLVSFEMKGQTPREVNIINLNDLLMHTIEKYSYIVVSSDAPMNVKVSKEFSTKGIINPPIEQVVHVSDPIINLSNKACYGCPGYTILFNRIINSINNLQKNKFVTKNDSVRYFQLKHQLLQFIKIILDNDIDDDITKDLSEINLGRLLDAAVFECCVM